MSKRFTKKYLDINFNPRDTLTASVLYNNKNSKKNLVKAVTLSSILKNNKIKKIDFFSLDVEGYEYEVLTSFTKLIKNTIICFEWAEEQKNKIEKILNHIKNLGYNNFSYTEADKVLFNDEIKWSSFENFDIIKKLNPEKKDKWGMIYFKFT